LEELVGGIDLEIQRPYVLATILLMVSVIIFPLLPFIIINVQLMMTNGTLMIMNGRSEEMVNETRSDIVAKTIRTDFKVDRF